MSKGKKKVEIYADGSIRGVFDPKDHDALRTAAFDLLIARLISDEMAKSIIAETLRQEDCGEPAYDPDRSKLPGWWQDERAG